ncbi:unnamed protein product [Owenia fusiformis]|uniref:Uncharacterized protein n=1 Tax=Owenia fusiformis TaxID=6347 RepID=A0A8J1Y7M1_OWEFU|nr:unnamed protein product [Owenia fusiformis]
MRHKSRHHRGHHGPKIQLRFGMGLAGSSTMGQSQATYGPQGYVPPPRNHNALPQGPHKYTLGIGLLVVGLVTFIIATIIIGVGRSMIFWGVNPLIVVGAIFYLVAIVIITVGVALFQNARRKNIMALTVGTENYNIPPGPVVTTIQPMNHAIQPMQQDQQIQQQYWNQWQQYQQQNSQPSQNPQGAPPLGQPNVLQYPQGVADPGQPIPPQYPQNQAYSSPYQQGPSQQVQGPPPIQELTQGQIYPPPYLQESPHHGAQVQGSPPQEALIQGPPPQEALIQGPPPQEALIQGPPPQESLIQGPPPQGAPIQGPPPPNDGSSHPNENKEPTANGQVEKENKVGTENNTDGLTPVN